MKGVQPHAVRGGSGPALVVLHGWPRCWRDWRDSMEELAAGRTVSAVDLPGLGGSSGEPATDEKATLAPLVHSLVRPRVPDRAVHIGA